MIVGIGVDLMKIEKIKKAVEKWGDRFLSRVFTEGEIAYAYGKRNPFQHLTARFAVKEAVFKALGTGWSKGLGWKDVEISSMENNKPHVQLSNMAKSLAKEKNVIDILVSLSHDTENAIAQVILLNTKA